MSDLYKADGTPIHVGQDGTPRKTRYGTGKQPWDIMKELGWAPHFAAGNVLKYLRREKDREHSIESARWYYRRLSEIVGDVYLQDPDLSKCSVIYWDTARDALKELDKLLTDEEKEILRASPEAAR